jgi:hypothetical protein
MRMPRFARPLVALLAAAALAAPAAADVFDGVDWMPGLKPAFEAAKARGAPILVWCLGDDGDSERKDAESLRDPKVRQAMRGYLVVFANPHERHGSMEFVVDGKGVVGCKLAPGIRCASHQLAWNEVYKSFADVMSKDGNIKVPNHFVLDPDGKVLGTINNGDLSRGFDPVTPADMVKGLTSLMAKVGPGITAEQLEDFRQRLVRARAAADARRFAEAAKEIEPILAVKKNIGSVVEAKEVLVRVDGEAAGVLAKARAVRKTGGVLEALTLLDRVSRDYPGTESAAAAAKEFEELKKSPEGRKAQAELKREAEGREALKKALALAAAGGKDAEAVRLLEQVATRFKGLPVAAEAAAEAEKILADPVRAEAVKKAHAERQARDKLLEAKALLDSGKKVDAHVLL